MHPIPRRMLFVHIRGEHEVTAEDSETRRFAAGSVILAEDITGTGHVSRITGSDGLLALVFSLPEA
jgi:hypothetical protein